MSFFLSSFRFSAFFLATTLLGSSDAQ